jgi:2-C-methyl-D-erythritol 2,4-cyclodiphosphate synthase
MRGNIYQAGIGYDIHRLVKGRKLFLGGVRIPYPKGLSGHSDADVLLHAICDALLGGMGLSDIGEHFPNTDIKYRGIRSTELLKKVTQLMKKNGFSIVNLDTTVVAQAPRISLRRLEIQKNIARILHLKPKAVNLKATTAEGLGDIGKNKAIAAWCVALLRRVK